MTDAKVAPEPGVFWSVALPAGATTPMEVYVNGTPRREGEHYLVDGRWLRFGEELRPKLRIGFGRRLMLLSGIGTYGDLKADVVDIHWDGGRSSAHDLEIFPPQAPLNGP